MARLIKTAKISLLFILFLTIQPLVSDAIIYVPAESWVYDALYKLEAEGIIKSSLITNRPVSRMEIARLIREASNSPKLKQDKYLYTLFRKLKYEFREELNKFHYFYIKPFDFIETRFTYCSEDNCFLEVNNLGRDYKDGSNYEIISAAMIEPESKRWGVYAGYNIRDFSKLELERLYLAVKYKKLELELGKDAQWWGPAKDGSILLSTNAEPFKMIRLSNSHPVILPWAFKHLGLFRFNFFVTRLEAERFVPEPILWGLALQFKISPYVEIGLQRTALLGGKGRKEDLNTWIKSFLAYQENTPNEAGDQRAGFYVKLILPFKVQPAVVYFDGAGEDEAGNLPSRWAYTVGLYMPRILNYRNIELTIEHTDTLTDMPNVWYVHHIYRSGYTYYGRIIGHYIGGGSKEDFIKMKIAIKDFVLSPSLRKIHSERYNTDVTYYCISLKKDTFGIEYYKAEGDRNEKAFTIYAIFEF